MKRDVLGLVGKVKPAALTVFVALTKFVNEETGTCFPSQALLATTCRLSERTVRTALKELHAAGWVDIEPRKKADGTNYPNVYKLADTSQDAHEATGNICRLTKVYKQEHTPGYRNSKTRARKVLGQGYVHLLVGPANKTVPQEIYDAFSAPHPVRDTLEWMLRDQTGTDYMIVDRDTGEVVLKLKVDRPTASSTQVPPAEVDAELSQHADVDKVLSDVEVPSGGVSSFKTSLIAATICRDLQTSDGMCELDAREPVEEEAEKRTSPLEQCPPKVKMPIGSWDNSISHQSQPCTWTPKSRVLNRQDGRRRGRQRYRGLRGDSRGLYGADVRHRHIARMSKSKSIRNLFAVPVIYRPSSTKEPSAERTTLSPSFSRVKP